MRGRSGLQEGGLAERVLLRRLEERIVVLVAVDTDDHWREVVFVVACLSRSRITVRILRSGIVVPILLHPGVRIGAGLLFLRILCGFLLRRVGFCS